MWLASIWTFTLRLPWALGADFFLRHLVDADPASNTLSWRWVVGLQTPGKTYRATADNIDRYTGGRFSPRGLAVEAPALTYLPGHDNGIVIELPSPRDGGTREVVGTLTFGVGTIAADGIGAPGILRIEAASRFTTAFGGRTYPSSYIDRRTETYVLHNDGLPGCRDMVWAY